MCRRILSILFLLGIVNGFVHETRADDRLIESFDDGEPTVQVVHSASAFQLQEHQRQAAEKQYGDGAEVVRGVTGDRGDQVDFIQQVPPAAVIEELTATLWLRANYPGLKLHLRVVFPDSLDPETGQPITALALGDEYRIANQWQQVTCRATPEAIRDAVRRTRYRFPDEAIENTNLYVDAVVVTTSFGPRTTPFEIYFDHLEFGPVVTPRNVIAPSEPKGAMASNDLKPVVDFRLNQLRVEGKPFFPIITPFYGEAGESLELFANSGVNVAWIPDYHDLALVERLREAGLWITAEPPRARNEEGELLEGGEAGIIPFGPETQSVLFWNFSSRIPVDSLDRLIDWVNQVHAADATLNRPTLADVTGATYAFSNHIDLLAVSRHITNTSIAFDHYRDWLRGRRADAFVNTFFWTWIQTEPSEQASSTREAAGYRPIVIEPEQIRLQVFAALQAGCRGIGYWRTIPFGTAGAGMDERRLILTRLNLELKTLAPLLATADSPGNPTTFNVEGQRPGSEGTRVRRSYTPVTLTGPQAPKTPFAASEGPAGQADAVMMRTDQGPLMIAAWYGDDSQFCPGRLSRNDVRIVVPGVEETAPAWLISPTDVQLLESRRVAGGKEITFNKFDQTAVVLFTSDTNVIRQLQASVAENAPMLAAASVELARFKRERVAATHAQLSVVAPPLPDGAAILRKADEFLIEAETALRQGNVHEARVAADDCMQSLRILQHAHWSDAIRPLGSPLTSPHTISYSTLPDHYELIAKVGRSLMAPSYGANILPSGSFEDNDQTLSDGWEHVADTPDGTSAGADLVATSPHSGRYALELYAARRPGYEDRRHGESAFVTFRSPPLPVRVGTVLHISGWVNMIEPVSPERDGATVHDNFMGLSSGLRWTTTQGWQRFELLREVPEDGEFRLTLALHGEGRVQFDDLQVVPHTPHLTLANQPPPPPEPRRE